jgi:hypothetical protein
MSVRGLFETHLTVTDVPRSVAFYRDGCPPPPFTSRTPDGHQLEFLAMLDAPPAPEIGVVPWSEFERRD